MKLLTNLLLEKLLLRTRQAKRSKGLEQIMVLNFVIVSLIIFCVRNGIARKHTCAYTPQKNGVAERFNRTIMDKVRCMLSESGLNEKFWAEVASTTCYLINSSPNSSLEFKVT